MTQRLVLAVLLSTSMLSADTLVLRDGTHVEGSFVGGDSRSVRFAVGQKVNSYSLSDVATIDFTTTAQSSTVSPASPYAGTSPAAPNATAAAGSVEIPAGTPVVVRLIDPVNSEQDRLGQTFRCSVDQPVVVNGQTVIPRGADAVASLIDASKSGHIEGRTVLTLDLKKVTVNGQTYDVTTTGVAEASDARGAHSAKVIGGTAALGAIIGAIAGGGKGAAIGAGSGAAVGTAAQVATSGQKVKIPSETRLTFTLQNALDLHG